MIVLIARGGVLLHLILTCFLGILKRHLRRRRRKREASSKSSSKVCVSENLELPSISMPGNGLAHPFSHLVVPTNRAPANRDRRPNLPVDLLTPHARAKITRNQ